MLIICHWLLNMALKSVAPMIPGNKVFFCIMCWSCHQLVIMDWFWNTTCISHWIKSTYRSDIYFGDTTCYKYLAVLWVHWSSYTVIERTCTMQIVSLLHMMKERHFGRASEENFIVWGCMCVWEWLLWMDKNSCHKVKEMPRCSCYMKTKRCVVVWSAVLPSLILWLILMCTTRCCQEWHFL